MTKLLKIRFVKFEKALAMQILEQVGIFKATEHVQAIGFPAISNTCIYLRSKNLEYDNNIGCTHFNDNAERDEYLDKVVKWISEELFMTKGKLEAGEMCEVSNDGKSWAWNTRELLAVLPESYYERYITNAADSKTKWSAWTYARPINSCVQPERDCGVFTWEKPGVNNKIKI